jgi:hypothetical protein
MAPFPLNATSNPDRATWSGKRHQVRINPPGPDRAWRGPHLVERSAERRARSGPCVVRCGLGPIVRENPIRVFTGKGGKSGKGPLSGPQHARCGPRCVDPDCATLSRTARESADRTRGRPDRPVHGPHIPPFPVKPTDGGAARANTPTYLLGSVEKMNRITPDRAPRSRLPSAPHAHAPRCVLTVAPTRAELAVCKTTEKSGIRARAERSDGGQQQRLRA